MWEAIRYWSRWGNRRCKVCRKKFDLDDPYGRGMAVAASNEDWVHGRCMARYAEVGNS